MFVKKDFLFLEKRNKKNAELPLRKGERDKGEEKKKFFFLERCEKGEKVNKKTCLFQNYSE